MSTNNDGIFHLFLNLDKALKNSTPGEFAYIQQSKRVGIIAIKIENREFPIILSDVLPAAAILHLKVPIY